MLFVGCCRRELAIFLLSSCVRWHLKTLSFRKRLAAMSTQSYSPVRSAIILTLSFLLPLLLSFYSTQLSELYTSLWHQKQRMPWTSPRNATEQISPLFAQQMTVWPLTHHLCFNNAHNIQEDASRMLTELQRDTGKWNSNHPRYRLLSSMMAFMRYGEDRTTELDTWRKRYKKLPRSQRTVRQNSVQYRHRH